MSFYWNIAPGGDIGMFDQLIWVASSADKTWSILKFTGAPQLARWLLRRRGGVVRSGGFAFFPNRVALTQATGTLANRLAGASSVSALFITGGVFYRAHENHAVIARLLLPHPEGEAYKSFCKTVKSYDSPKVIRDITKLARKAGTRVKWCDPFIFHSIILADTDRSSGWVHIETIFPYSKLERRLSYTMHKPQFEEEIREAQRVFEEIWLNSDDAPGS
jgi:hypothetical protein